jgi:AmmeMemoRadiSam system protein B
MKSKFKTRNSKSKLILLIWILCLGFWTSSAKAEDTWANWEKRFDRAFDGIKPRKMPGRAMGILVPNQTRHDLIAMPAFGYETLANQNFGTVLLFLPAPEQMTDDGLVMPDLDRIETPVGDFSVDLGLAQKLEDADLNIHFDNTYFSPKAQPILESQLAALKYVLSGKTARIKVLPIYVKLSNPNDQTKDIAPTIADRIKDLDLSEDIVVVIAGDLSETKSKKQLIESDSIWLNANRNLDSDTVLSIAITEASSDTAKIATPDVGVIALGLLTLKWLGADHGEVLAYCHSAQLILTKDKSALESYATAAFASSPIIMPKLPYFNREKMVDTFGELLRTDILTLTRQTCASAIDPTAAKPPSLIDKQASRRWPVYVTLYNAQGEPAGQAGSHVPVGALEESLRRFAVEAVKNARPAINKANFSTYVVDVSIPYGFLKVDRPEELVPLLNGLIVHSGYKTSAMHPDGWRKYPDAQQLLGEICYGLGMKPWAYATSEARVESFRVLSFNEKEPFQDLGAASRKKKKKSTTEEEDTGGDAGGGGSDGALPF